MNFFGTDSPRSAATSHAPSRLAAPVLAAGKSIPALFVAGTDTGAGKTRVATALCRELSSRGLRVGVLKPAETGCDPSSPPDALALLTASGCQAPLELVCPYRFEQPMAPGIAAELAGRVIDPGHLSDCLGKLRETHDVVVCEGAGGLLVPLTGELLTAEWIALEKLPVLLVGRLGLGTINHTLLSARYLKERNIPFLGTVLSATEPVSDEAARTNPQVLSRYPEAALLGVMEHGTSKIPAAAVEAVLSLLR